MKFELPSGLEMSVYRRRSRHCAGPAGKIKEKCGLKEEDDELNLGQFSESALATFFSFGIVVWQLEFI